ncbi:MAG: discoidin domain-containing protein [Bacillus sp. (in: Bacteria)]|nr:discoidin domain-containing protein [Bacillus sp. (in: firmicutes)]
MAKYAEAAKLAREEGLGIWNPEDPLLEMPFVFRARESGRPLSRYVGNFATKEFVAPDHFEIVPPEYRVFFTKQQALNLGYTPLELSDQEAIDMDKNALAVEFQGSDSAASVVNNVVLMTEGSYGSTISWESSHPEVIATTGEVTNPDFSDVEVTLTATIEKGNLIEKKVFTVTVVPAIIELVSWNFDAENPVATGGIESNTSQEIVTVGSAITGYVAGFGNPSRAINSNGWDAEGDNYWLIEVETVGYKNITLSSRQFGSNTGPRDFQVQYSLDNKTWVDVEGAEVTVANNWNSGIVDNVLLPEEVENQEVVYVRWLNTSNVSINGGTVGSGGTNRMDDIFLTGNIGLFGEDAETGTPVGEEEQEKVGDGEGPDEPVVPGDEEEASNDQSPADGDESFEAPVTGDKATKIRRLKKVN